MKKNLIYLPTGALLVFLVSCFIFYDSYRFQVWSSDGMLKYVSDLPVHTRFVVDFSRNGNFPAYTIWYRAVYLLSGFSQNYDYLATVSIIFLALLNVFKFAVSFWILGQRCNDKKIVMLVALALTFVMPIISYSAAVDSTLRTAHIYMGNIAPNQWHNSTLILAMPVNILWFYYSIKHRRSERLFPFVLMGALSFSSIVCKPNYALAFLPVLCMAILFQNVRLKKYSAALIKIMLVAAPSFLVLCYQWYFTFVRNDVFSHPARTILAPFFVWSYYSSNIPVSTLVSIAFPLLVLVFYFRKADSHLLFSWLTFAAALVMMSLLSEYPQWQSGNYFWGAIAANYILFLFSLNLLSEQPVDWRFKISCSVFGMHVVSGIYYLLSFITQQTTLFF